MINMKNFLILFFIAFALCVIQYVLGNNAVLSIATAFSISSVAIGIWLSLEAHKLKTKSEKAEIDIKLMSLFTKIMGIAHARGGYVVSEKVIEKTFDCGLFGKDDIKDRNKIEEFNKLNNKIADVSVISIPVGVAEQDAAITAIAILAERHEVLREVAIEGLRSLSKFKPEVAGKYLERLTKE